MQSSLSEFIRLHRREIIDDWGRHVRLYFRLDDVSRPLLINDLPEFLDELVACLSIPVESWTRHDGAQHHGRQRLELGVKIDQLVREFSMVGESILRVARSQGVSFSIQQCESLFELIGAGGAQAAGQYAKLRDRQVEQQAAEHFSFIAHEIRNPLHTARIASSLLKARSQSDSGTWQRLEQAHARLSELVDNAILGARMFGEFQLRRVPVDLRELGREIANELSPQAESRNIRIGLELEPISASADRKLIHSAISNLLGNAIKFTRTGGSISVRLSEFEQFACFEIEDECGGIPERVAKELFEPFAQGAKDKTGFGIGLMIVQQAAEAHGGSVSVENLPAKGCCFRLQLPLTASEADH